MTDDQVPAFPNYPGPHFATHAQAKPLFKMIKMMLKPRKQVKTKHRSRLKKKRNDPFY